MFLKTCPLTYVADYQIYGDSTEVGNRRRMKSWA